MEVSERFFYQFSLAMVAMISGLDALLRVAPPNQITAHNAGWPSQFRFTVHASWPACVSSIERTNESCDPIKRGAGSS